MEKRTASNLRAAIGLAAICLFTAPVPGFAQTGMEYPRTMPGGGGYGGSMGGGSIGGGGISAPGPSGGGPTKTTEVPYDGGPDTAPGTASTSPTHTRKHTTRRSKAVPEDSSRVEPATGHLKLIKNTYAYERPTSSSTKIEPVVAGKFVNVIGVSRYYAQVKLKNSEIAYVPLSALALVSPTDKMFKLTADASVLNAPNHLGAKIAEVHRGHDVHVIGVALNYMKIRMKSGVEGYIPVSALE